MSSWYTVKEINQTFLLSSFPFSSSISLSLSFLLYYDETFTNESTFGIK